MYKENQNKLINIVDDGDIIHVFITAPSKKKDKVEDALKSSFRELSKICLKSSYSSNDSNVK